MRINGKSNSEGSAFLLYHTLVLSTSALLLPLLSGCCIGQSIIRMSFRGVGNSLLHCCIVPAKCHKGRQSVSPLMSSLGKKHWMSKSPFPPHYIFEACSVIAPCTASNLSSKITIGIDNSAVLVYTAERDSSPRARFFLQSLVAHQIQQRYIRSRIWIRIFICHLAPIWCGYK